MLTVIETDPSTGVDTIIQVPEEYVERMPARYICQFGWIPWDVWGDGGIRPDGTPCD